VSQCSVKPVSRGHSSNVPLALRSIRLPPHRNPSSETLTRPQFRAHTLLFPPTQKKRLCLPFILYLKNQNGNACSALLPPPSYCERGYLFVIPKPPELSRKASPTGRNLFSRPMKLWEEEELQREHQKFLLRLSPVRCPFTLALPRRCIDAPRRGFPGPGALTRALLTLPRDTFDRLLVLENHPAYLDYLKVNLRIYARPSASRHPGLTRSLLYVAIGKN
jgi:hypothetical protein